MHIKRDMGWPLPYPEAFSMSINSVNKNIVNNVVWGVKLCGVSLYVLLNA